MREWEQYRDCEGKEIERQTPNEKNKEQTAEKAIMCASSMTKEVTSWFEKNKTRGWKKIKITFNNFGRYSGSWMQEKCHVKYI